MTRKLFDENPAVRIAARCFGGMLVYVNFRPELSSTPVNDVQVSLDHAVSIVHHPFLNQTNYLMHAKKDMVPAIINFAA